MLAILLLTVGRRRQAQKHIPMTMVAWAKQLDLVIAGGAQAYMRPDCVHVIPISALRDNGI